MYEKNERDEKLFQFTFKMDNKDFFINLHITFYTSYYISKSCFMFCEKYLTENSFRFYIRVNVNLKKKFNFPMAFSCFDFMNKFN